MSDFIIGHVTDPKEGPLDAGRRLDICRLSVL